MLLVQRVVGDPEVIVLASTDVIQGLVLHELGALLGRGLLALVGVVHALELVGGLQEA